MRMSTTRRRRNVHYCPIPLAIFSASSFEPAVNQQRRFLKRSRSLFRPRSSCTSELPTSKESPPDDVGGSKDTSNTNVDPDSKEMATFWSSIEGFFASSSSGAGSLEGEEDGFAELCQTEDGNLLKHS